MSHWVPNAEWGIVTTLCTLKIFFQLRAILLNALDNQEYCRTCLSSPLAAVRLECSRQLKFSVYELIDVSDVPIGSSFRTSCIRT